MSWYASERYRQLTKAVEARDHVWQTDLIEQAIGATAGGERAFWLLMRGARRIKLMAPVLDASWSDLQTALQLAPHDRIIRRQALTLAMTMSFYTENLDRLWPLLQHLKADLWGMRKESFIQANIAWLHTKRGRWAAAYRALSRAIRAMDRMSDAERESTRGLLVSLYARRVPVAYAHGLPEQAEADEQTAAGLAAPLEPSRINCVIMGLAKAEVAYHHRRFQEARAALQQALIQEASGKYLKVWPDLHIEMELLAARLARAEGKPEAFQYFTDRALEMVARHRLPMTEVRVRAVIRGAEH